MQWVSSADDFISARKLRNLLLHEYMSDPNLFLEALPAAKAATELLFEVIDRVNTEAVSRNLIQNAKGMNQP